MDDSIRGLSGSFAVTMSSNSSLCVSSTKADLLNSISMLVQVMMWCCGRKEEAIASADVLRGESRGCEGKMRREGSKKKHTDRLGGSLLLQAFAGQKRRIWVQGSCVHLCTYIAGPRNVVVEKAMV